MNVFISWSGERSLQVAKLLRSWLKCVLQATNPWISSDNIERGTMWFQDISESLNNCSIGILCLTKDNRNAPWILFEAGGLLKGLSTNRVCTFLIDLEPKDIEPPLSQFNHTLPTREGLFQLISTLNNHLDHNKLDETTLSKVFQTYWASFEEEFLQILEKTKEKQADESVRTENDLLTEILYTVRSMNQQFKKATPQESACTFLETCHNSLCTEASHTISPFQAFKIGDLIMHRIFGQGQITGINKVGNEWMLTVNFDAAGSKQLMYSYLLKKDLLIATDE